MNIIRCVETNILYYTAGDAARATGVSIQAIWKALSGEHMTAGGYHWVRVFPDDPMLRPCAGLSCAYTPGSPCCKGCGWDPQEHERRVGMIETVGLKKNKAGKKYLCLGGRKENTDELS